MRLSVAADDATRPRQNSRIEYAIAVLLEHSEDGEGVQLGTERRQSLSRRSGDCLSKRQSLFQAFEAVPGDRALGKYNESGSVADGFSESVFDGLQITVDFAQLDVHLNGCDFHVSYLQGRSGSQAPSRILQFSARFTGIFVRKLTVTPSGVRIEATKTARTELSPPGRWRTQRSGAVCRSLRVGSGGC